MGLPGRLWHFLRISGSLFDFAFYSCSLTASPNFRLQYHLWEREKAVNEKPSRCPAGSDIFSTSMDFYRNPITSRVFLLSFRLWRLFKVFLVKSVNDQSLLCFERQ
ncbi:hypothetical protein DdX_10833 [Ditylenchus destructor]|uniref:Uncharacterized protein n=1 Tax=Ditylenchus destructor TaxID=166010 RepID=A0AAD4MYC4_9BILA|nr:hypothetical protein DdX_10833 [Ditylenchus destructor]